MTIVIFGDNYSFPEGDASTNRVYTYAKGFYENGVNVHVICFANEYNSAGDGVINGINFYHTFGQRRRSKSFLIRRVQKLTKFYKTHKLIRSINKNDKISAIISYTMRLSTHLFAWYLSRITRSKLIKECSEHPLIHYQGGTVKRVQGAFKFMIEARLSDGIFCISRYLLEFYKVHGIHPGKLILVPSTVDPTRFDLNEEKLLPYPYIGYFGGLTFKRDNVDLLINSFAEISNTHPDIQLVLGGFCTEKERNQIENLIKNLQLTEKILLLKYLPRAEIVSYIRNSDILVMVRARDLETQASFPSKLTEYLATSKPVVTVNVGEIPDYLTDGVNAFIIPPGDGKRLTEKLDFVMKNYDFALEVGQRGKELAFTTFNYYFQAKRIINFIDTL